MITRIDPEDSHPTSGYAHVTLVESGRLAFFAGQMPMDDSGERVVGVGDLDAQVDRTVVNAARALAAVGARPEDVVRTTVYVVASAAAEAGRAWHRFAGSEIGAAFTSASTLLGVAVLGFPDQLVELEMTAALSAPGPAAPSAGTPR
ncbi:RidA family protein [Pseudonocardia humida]|uniref:RidA family protein n=1 Tax=Pseudonocardia humida TaxID=2800819 RepID=UPI00207D2CB2|nr:Rid family hydrolase [Pseudonocardia humida]